ncbi:hypothetical protein, partial [Bifidobacterium pullorum]|uniref:hypothetical protein n=1 Tax=Bifidobacterium pullorum TaxID=78448 RepID=UPI0019D3C141
DALPTELRRNAACPANCRAQDEHIIPFFGECKSGMSLQIARERQGYADLLGCWSSSTITGVSVRGRFL